MTDRFIVRAVTLTICLNTSLGVALVGYLASTGTVIPDQLDRLTTLFAGALIGFLVKTGVDRLASDPPPPSTPVHIVNTPTDPVPTEDV